MGEVTMDFDVAFFNFATTVTYFGKEERLVTSNIRSSVLTLELTLLDQ